MGGVPTNWRGECLTTDSKGNDQIIEGLYAAGEAGCSSVHGANRLGANSLLDLVVFGRGAAKTIAAKHKPGEKVPDLPDSAGEQSVANLDWILHKEGSVSTADLRLKMQRCMQSHAAVFRDGPVLQEGCELMSEIFKELKDVKVTDK